MNTLDGTFGITPRTYVTDPMHYLHAATNRMRLAIYKSGAHAFNPQSFIAITTEPILRHAVASIGWGPNGREFVFDPEFASPLWIHGVRYFYSTSAVEREVWYYDVGNGFVFEPVFKIVNIAV